MMSNKKCGSVLIQDASVFTGTGPTGSVEGADHGGLLLGGLLLGGLLPIGLTHTREGHQRLGHLPAEQQVDAGVGAAV